MKKSLFFRSEHLYIVLIFFLAFFVRAWGIEYGLPYKYYSDEPLVVEHALKFGTGDLNPHFFSYPTLYMYLLFFLYGFYFFIGQLAGFFTSVSDFAVAYFIDPTNFYLIARFATAVIGSLTVVLTYSVGKKLFGRNVGILSALFLALNHLHVINSRIAITYAPATLFVLVSFYFSILLLDKGKLRYYLLGGFFGGLAAATHYIAGIIVVSSFVAHLLRMHSERSLAKALFNRRTFLVILSPIVGFLIGSPYAFLDYRTFFAVLTSLPRSQNTPYLGIAYDSIPYIRVITTFLREGMGIPLTILALLGIIYCLIKRSTYSWLLVSFPLTYYLIIGRYITNVERFWVPVLPFLTIAAARLLKDSVDRLLLLYRSRIPILSPYKMLVMLAMAMMFVIPSLSRTIKYSYMISQKDTRTIAKEWIEENIPPHSRIAVELNGPQLYGNMLSIESGLKEKRFSYWRDVAVISKEVRDTYDYSATQGKYVLMAVEKMAPYQKQYYVFGTFSLGDNPLGFYKNERFDYLIVNSAQYDRFMRQADRYPQWADFYQQVFEEMELVKEFKPAPWSRPGPTIQIYRLNSAR